MSIVNRFAATIPFEEWEQTGDEDDKSSRLLCTGEINGLPLHVEAYAVTRSEQGEQDIATPYFEQEWRGMCLLNTDCAFRTVEINGREYVIFAQPFGD